MLAMALCMTGSDLNSSSKPWEVQFRTSKIVYAEFHEQVSQEILFPFIIKENQLREMWKKLLDGNLFHCLIETTIQNWLPCR